MNSPLTNFNSFLGLEPSPSVKFVATKNRPNCLSANFPSKDWWEKSPKILRLIWGSSPALLWLFKKPLRPTWLDSLKTPTCVPSMPREWPSCPRTSNWPEESEERELKKFLSQLLSTWQQTVFLKTTKTNIKTSNFLLYCGKYEQNIFKWKINNKKYTYYLKYFQRKSVNSFKIIMRLDNLAKVSEIISHQLFYG